MAASTNKSIETYSKDAWDQQAESERHAFEAANRCCGYDFPQDCEPSNNYKTPCHTSFLHTFESYPPLALKVSIIGVAGEAFCLMMSMIVLSKLNAAQKKKSRRQRREESRNPNEPPKRHKTTEQGSRFGAALDAA